MATTGGSNSNGLTRSNVSVTNINCDTIASQHATAPVGQSNNNYFNNAGGIRICVPKMENESDESETELTNIEQTAKVNLRMNETSAQGPRPMSWEGELSEVEESLDNENGANVETVHAVSFANTISGNHTSATPSNNIPVISVNSKNSNIKRENEAPAPNAVFASNKKLIPDLANIKFESGLSDLNVVMNSPLLARSKSNLIPANPSPDSAIHSIYTHSSPGQSPLTARHASYTPSLSRNNSDASHSSCYSYSSEFSPTHSPIQGRHQIYSNGFNGSPLHHSVLYRPIIDSENGARAMAQEDNILENESIPSAGISRQQLINSPCPICGDKISGFHYGIFSCESCKGFFKRTVQNRKNYVCLRGAACPVTISTRKKCPACRFEKCLQRGMKLEAIREDRTRGGRSTYQCSYTFPNLPPVTNSESTSSRMTNETSFKAESVDSKVYQNQRVVPTLLQEIMDVEHLWHFTESELNRLNQAPSSTPSGNLAANPLLASAGLANGDNSNPDLIANLCNVADHRLYKIVKWCKSLPLFKHISIDDQISLLINSWCELLLFSCCFRSVSTPGEVLISLGKSINLDQAKTNGLQACIERMLNLTDHLRRLRVDKYEYIAMKVIVLLQSDTSDLREPEKVCASQEKALQALQQYTLSHYPESPSKFGELLLRIPELQRTCQVGKEMLTIKSQDGEDFNLLMELLRGEH
ncbi:hypothetical protein HA402_004058 [Bradysia odoriphaga]|nr:hypothetical protein HA402_004058 [Bradysia odoriphaga]